MWLYVYVGEVDLTLTMTEVLVPHGAVLSPLPPALTMVGAQGQLLWTLRDPPGSTSRLATRSPPPHPPTPMLLSRTQYIVHLCPTLSNSNSWKRIYADKT